MNRFTEVMNNGGFIVGSVCADCANAHESGDASGNSHEWNEAGFRATLAAYEAMIGHPHNSWRFTGCYHYGQECGDDCECEKASLSNVICVMCSTGLYGERHDYTFIPRSILEA